MVNLAAGVYRRQLGPRNPHNLTPVNAQPHLTSTPVCGHQRVQRLRLLTTVEWAYKP